MKNILILFIISISIFSCKNNEAQDKDPFKDYADGNVFNDKLIEEIARFQYNRDSQNLIKKIKTDYSKDDKYLNFALSAYSSIQDSNAIEYISTFLNHENSEIRKTTAFALGQINSVLAERFLLSAYNIEKEDNVKAEIIVAIGKCGSYTGLDFINKQKFNISNKIVLTGKIRAVAKFAERNYILDELTDKIFNLLNNNKLPEEAKYWSTYYIYRANVEVTNYDEILISVFENSNSLFTKDNVIKSVKKSSSTEILSFLKAIILDDTEDYRNKVSAIRSLQAYDYIESESLMKKLLLNKNIHIAITASEFFIKKGTKDNSEEYYNLAKSIKNRHIRTNMLTAALKFSENKGKISNAIKSGIEASENIYEKAKLIEALSYNLATYYYLKQIAFNTEEKILATAAITALSNMRYSSKFTSFALKYSKERNVNLEIEFAEIFKQAILSGDVALMSIAAGILRDKKFNYINIYDNTFFIKQAISKCNLPADIEAYNELIKTDSYINGSNNNEPIKIEYKTPDFDFIKRIKPDQKVKFITEKGDFIMQLNVNQAPVSVSTFLELIKNKFYDGKHIHRVVQNFVIQGGCTRGDGWGSPGFAIRSEFSSIFYDEGVVGIASAGKDTESSQWFITHTQTPHLNGKYTVIGKIIEGLNIIHDIQIGNTVISVEIL